MTVLRIGEGILSIAEIVGIFYLLFMFSEKRDTRKWKDGLLYLLVDLSEDYKRFVFALFYVDMYQFCFYFSLFVFKIGIMEMLFNNSIIFRNTVFF